MLTIHIRKGMIGEDGTLTKRVPFQEGLTPRKLVDRLQDVLPHHVPIDVAINGQLLDDGDYEQDIKDNDELIFCPLTTAGIDWLAYIVYAVISAVVSVAVNYAVQALAGKPKGPDDPLLRGDEGSQTYAWNGVRTNYSQGFLVPVCYGRHAVGGQVVYSSSSQKPGAGNTFVINSDYLTLVLALSEGPIDKVGELKVTSNDWLGSTSSYTSLSSGALPSNMRINGQVLPTENLEGINTFRFFGLASWDPSTPGLTLGAAVYFRNHTAGVNIISGPHTVVKIYGLASNPQIEISTEPSAAVTSALASGDDIYVHQGLPNSNNSQPRRLITSVGTVVKVVPNAGAFACIRSGEVDQPPMPSQLGFFAGTQTTFNQNLELGNWGDEQIWTYDSGTRLVTGINLSFTARGGMYTVSGTSGLQIPYAACFNISWRIDGGPCTFGTQPPNASIAIQLFRTGQTRLAKEEYFADFTATNGEAVKGVIEVRIQRITPAGPSGTVSSVTWSDASVQSPYELTYPRTACVGLVLEANARFNGGLPQCNIRIDGKTIRVWHPTNGWSPRCWDVPSAPWNYHTYAPGRNPAWILADFLLSPWGLGSYLTEDDIDLPSIAAWAVYCDRDPNPSDPWGEPQFTCDLVLDQARPAWEWVITICSAGRATPVFANGKISVVYEYKDAHSQGPISVPAKASSQLFTTGNLQDFAVTWLPRASRPTAFVYQFLNEDENYKQDVMTVEDSEGTLNDPSELFGDQWRPQQQQLFGTTRPSQVFRDAMFRHRVNRLIARRVDFKTGRWALIGQVGDLIDIETEVMRPFDAVASSGVVLVGGNSVTELKVDHNNLPSTGQIKIRQPDGSPVVANWTSVATGKVENTEASIIQLSSSVTVAAGAACVYGTADKLVETYLITGITITKNLERLVTALQYVPEVYADIAPSSFNTGNDYGNVIANSPSWEDDPLPLQETISINKLDNGKQRVSWVPRNQGASAQTFVYYRNKSGDQKWLLMGSTTSAFIDTDQLSPDASYDFSIAPEDWKQQARMPEQGTVATVSVEEWTPTQAPQISSVTTDTAGLLSWAKISAEGVDAFEVREGLQWVGARSLFKGKSSSASWAIPPAQNNLTICVQMKDGSQGQPTVVTLPAWQPEGATSYVDYNALTSGTGTHSGTAMVGTSYLQLQPGLLAGNYTTASLSPGFKGPFLWRVKLDVREYDGQLVDESVIDVDSAQAAWGTVDAREASPYQPGVDFGRAVDNETLAVEHYDNEIVSGYIGASGKHTSIELQGRFYDGASWSSWQTWVDQERTAQQCEVRLYMYRETAKHEVQVHGFNVLAQL